MASTRSRRHYVRSEPAANASASEEDEVIVAGPPPLRNAAPEVETTGLALVDDKAVRAGATQHLQDASARKTYYNLPFEQLHAPALGPAHPFSKDGMAAGLRNHRAGHVEDAHLSHFHFDDQYNTFMTYGYAVAPAGEGIIGDDEVAKAKQGETIAAAKPAKRQKTVPAEPQPAADIDPEEAWSLAVRQPWADKDVAPAILNDEQKAYLEQVAKEKAEKEEEEADKGPKAEKSVFHGKAEKNFAGVSWLEPPKNARAENEYCYLPKRWIHTWSGHTKGVNAIRFFPKWGHLLLSAGLDGKIKIWDVNGSGKNLRTYLGHSKGVRDINFNEDGRKFVSSSYDKAGIKLWDTETGQVISTLGEGKMYYTAKLHPNTDKQNMLFAGCADKKVYQWDANSGDLVQEYDYHLAAVNTITFVDEGRRFMTTSDDKTIRFWELGINVQIKYIADPGMHSIPSVAVHPNGKWLCGQSLDNQIVTYSALDKFRQNRKKVFKGHSSSGYACQVNFSTDGRYVISGDGEGRAFFWDWKTTKIFRSFKAHEGVCIGIEWHPLESSKVATCGWDGAIKYWD